MAEIAVDGDEVALVEHRHQHEGYAEIAHDEAQHHLKVGISLGGHHARNRDEGAAARAMCAPTP